MEVKGHINPGCVGWSESSIELNTYIQRIKHFVCVVLVMAHDPCPLVHVIGRYSAVMEDIIVLNSWCKTCNGLKYGGEGSQIWWLCCVVKKLCWVKHLITLG